MSDELPRDSDGDALRRLVATGSDLSKDMDIDFAMDIPEKDVGMAFATSAGQLGFRTELLYDDESRRWTCYCTRTMVPAYDAMIATQKTLEEIGRPLGVKPDGWGTLGNAP